VAISVNPNREHITLCIAVNAAGGHLEPFFVFKGLRRTPALREVLDDSQYALTESGYVNKAAWQDWVHYFLSNIPVKEDRNWILLILDGFGCHGNNPDLLEELYEEKVISFFLSFFFFFFLNGSFALSNFFLFFSLFSLFFLGKIGTGGCNPSSYIRCPPTLGCCKFWACEDPF